MGRKEEAHNEDFGQVRSLLLSIQHITHPHRNTKVCFYPFLIVKYSICYSNTHTPPLEMIHTMTDKTHLSKLIVNTSFPMHSQYTTQSDLMQILWWIFHTELTPTCWSCNDEVSSGWLVIGGSSNKFYSSVMTHDSSPGETCAMLATFTPLTTEVFTSLNKVKYHI